MSDDNKSNKDLIVLYSALIGFYVLLQPPTTPYITSILIVFMVIAIGVAGGAIAAFFTHRNKPFPIRRIMWSVLVVTTIFAIIMTYGSLQAYKYLAR